VTLLARSLLAIASMDSAAVVFSIFYRLRFSICAA
jgi:hypothetical protein